MDKKEVLKWLNQEDIFQHYLGFFGWRKLHPNPLRNDKNPGCSFWRSRTGVIYFNDFAKGKTYDCFQIVMEMYGLSFPEAVKKVAEDLLSEDKKESLQSKILHQKQEIDRLTKPIIKEKINFSLIGKKWNKSEWFFWKKYGITIKTLRKYKVKSLSYVAINNKTLFRSEADNPLFAYIVNKGVKIYRPYSISKANKWRNNLTEDDIEGLEQLGLDKLKAYKTRNLLIITKSLKDVMVLSEMGYDAIASHSETSMIKDELITKIKKHYKNVVVLFDNDSAGIKGALAYKERYGFDSIFLDLSKDISDSVVTLGFLETKAAFKNKIIKNGYDFSRTKKKF